jgi:hypothetical protein
MMGVRMVLEFIFTPAELKILDDPLPFKRSETKQDKDEEAEIQDISTEVRYLCLFLPLSLTKCNRYTMHLNGESTLVM